MSAYSSKGRAVESNLFRSCERPVSESEDKGGRNQSLNSSKGYMERFQNRARPSAKNLCWLHCDDFMGIQRGGFISPSYQKAFH